MIGPAGFMQAPKAMEVKRAVRYVAKGKKQFKLTFDEYGTLDTVCQVFRDKEPKPLNGANKDVQSFVKHQDKLFAWGPVPGMTLVHQSDLF